MRVCLLGLVALAGCASGPQPTSEGTGRGYVVLDETGDFWIVKVHKNGGPEALDRAARELRKEGADEPKTKEDPPADKPGTGQVAGRILRKGEGLSGCRVRLTPMKRNMGVLHWEEWTGEEPSAVTDAAGRFEVRGVPPGAYRLKWLAPGAASWVKRLKDKPDVIVEEGRTQLLADVEVNRPIR